MSNLAEAQFWVIWSVAAKSFQNGDLRYKENVFLFPT